MKPYQDTTMGGENRAFPKTEWTSIENSAQRKAILGELYSRYWKPLYRFLRHKGFSNEQSKDLVQNFFTEKILGQEFIQKADRTKGKFRNFLLVAIRNYAINASKAETYPRHLDENIGLTSQDYEPEEEFNRAWGEELLQVVLKELENKCCLEGKNTDWHLFHEWLIEPRIGGTYGKMDELCEKYGIDDPAKAYKCIFSMKKRFKELLRDHLRCETQADDQIDEEIIEFISLFSNK